MTTTYTIEDLIAAFKAGYDEGYNNGGDHATGHEWGYGYQKETRVKAKEAALQEFLAERTPQLS